MPPWLHALAYEDEAGSGSQGVDVSADPYSATPTRIALALADADFETFPLPLVPEESPACYEKLLEYSRVLERRVADLQRAVQRGEAALERRKAMAKGGDGVAEAPPRKGPDLCVVCMAAPRECAFTPCGHRCVCRICGISAVRIDRRCPICRQTAGRVLRIVDP